MSAVRIGRMAATNYGALPPGVRRLRIDPDALIDRVKLIDGRLTLDGAGDYVGLIFQSGNIGTETAEKAGSLAKAGASVVSVTRSASIPEG